MILCDKDIKARASEIFEKGYNEERVGCISYDILLSESGFLKYREPIWIACKEIIKVPLDLTVRVIPRNTDLRRGLRIEAAQYFPGHRTRVYLRVENLMKNPISFYEGESFAQLIFEKLTGFPEKAYEGSYQNEVREKGEKRANAEFFW